MQVQANGIQIEAEARGKDTDPALILIRGLGTQMVQWPEELLDGLVDARLRVITFDNRDVGLSQKIDSGGVPDIAAIASRQPGASAPYSLQDMADDTVGVLDAFGIARAWVLGISLGGMVAQRIAATHPDRTLGLISVMSSSGDPSVPPAKPEAMAALTSAAERPDDRECAIAHGLAGRRVWQSPGYPESDETIRADLGRAFDRCHDRQGIVRQMAAALADGSRRDLLRTIQVPTLVIHGADDPLIPLEAGRDTAGHIPGARLEIIAGMGHDVARGLVPRWIELVSEFVTQ